MKKLNLRLYESPHPPEDTSILWADIDETTGKMKAIHKYNKDKGELEPYMASTEFMGEDPGGGDTDTYPKVYSGDAIKAYVGSIEIHGEGSNQAVFLLWKDRPFSSYTEPSYYNIFQPNYPFVQFVQEGEIDNRIHIHVILNNKVDWSRTPINNLAVNLLGSSVVWDLSSDIDEVNDKYPTSQNLMAHVDKPLDEIHDNPILCIVVYKD